MNKSWEDFLERNTRLLRVIVVLIIVMNIPFGNLFLYPFVLFSTWIHESCHGLAAITVGGRVEWLNIYADGSGLAYTAVPVNDHVGFARVFVASAGYCGTSFVGGVLLMFRSSRGSGTRVGTGVVGACLIASCALVVRNVFGVVVLLVVGIGLTLCACGASDFWVGETYAALAATTCLNAVTSVRALYSPASSTVNGVVRPSDAFSVQEVTHVSYLVWATLWLLFALSCTALGLLIQYQPPPPAAAAEDNANVDSAAGDNPEKIEAKGPTSSPYAHIEILDGSRWA